MSITVYPARSIITMHPSRPIATHVAVRGGKILAVGSLEDIAPWGDYEIDPTFEDKVLMPGLIEGHSHIFEGMLWDHHFVGYFDRTGPDGTVHEGSKSLDAVIEKLQAIDATIEDPDAPLIGWGFDPIYFESIDVTAADLDRVSTTRPVMLLHASMHLVNTNSEVMRRSGVDRSINAEVVFKDAEGNPTGKFASMVGIYLAMKGLDLDIWKDAVSEPAIRNFARLGNRAGITTLTDLHSELNDYTVQQYINVTGQEDFPCRLVAAFGGTILPASEGLARVQAAQKLSTDKARFGIVKLVVDGSIQGFTARLLEPGYLNGAPNGLWYIEPAALPDVMATYHNAGHQMHIHTNGNEATELVINSLEKVLNASPRVDHRHTLQHCQMATEAQFFRMAEMGIGANLFANHCFFWGDLHYGKLLGPDRANRLSNCGAALENGVSLSIHSDAPITPLNPLFTAWCAVNRETATGRHLGGDEERISLEDALFTITMGAARSLHIDREVGSIEVGKRADFAVLEDDPYELGPEKLKDVRVWGTVLEGRIFPAHEG